MTKEEINKVVKECPYADKSIDSMHTCDLEFHYSICAERFGLLQKEQEGR